jgi:hypothetical protein
MADVTLTYKGATIAELDDSGSKTLRTAGKFCEADIGVEYVKPSGGGSETETVEIEVSAYKSYDTAVGFMTAYGGIAPYNYYYAKVVFRNNTENDRAGILLDFAITPNARFGFVKRVGKESIDLSWGIDVYAGATIAFTFIKLPY